MSTSPFEPQGLALTAYLAGDLDAELVIRRDDGLEQPLPTKHYFRDSGEFDAMERAAVQRCYGEILDVGAGAGTHSLCLQDNGLAVTALEINPQSAAIMLRRGVKQVQCADIFDFHDGPFDTILMMGHGIGMVETMAGLDRFLGHVRQLLAKEGQILLDSQDVRVTDNPQHLAYQDANRQVGRYVGEIRVQLGFRGIFGSIFGWLLIDPQMLTDRAHQARWACEIVACDESGHYLARLTP